MAHALLASAEKAAFRGLMRSPDTVKRLLAGRPVVLDGQTLDLDTHVMLRLQQLMREPAIESLPIVELRRAMLRQTGLVGGTQPVGAVRDLRVPGGDGPMAARLYIPRALTGPTAPAGALLFFIHGGGMMYGDLESHDATCRFLAEHAGTRVLAVDYRLAPEHPFPAAVDDCWTAYQWVAENAEVLGVDPERIALGGDSAGGALSAITAIRAAEAGVPCRVQLLIYPVTNLVEPSRSRRLFGKGFFLTEEFMQIVDKAYLPPGHDRGDPLVSVALTEKIPRGLAPAYVVTAGFDPLRDEGEAYARRLADEGVSVELKRYPSFVHGFVNMVGIRNPRAALAEIAARLRTGLAM